MKELEISCMSNYCAAKIKTKEYDDVIEMGKKILSLEKNGKAMFRMAQAYNAQDDLDNAEEFAISACSMFPGDVETRKLKEEIMMKIKLKEELEKNKANVSKEQELQKEREAQAQ